MSLYKYNITVKVDDEDDKYNEMTIRLGIKTAIQRHLRFASLHHNSNIPDGKTQRRERRAKAIRRRKGRL